MPTRKQISPKTSSSITQVSASGDILHLLATANVEIRPAVQLTTYEWIKGIATHLR